MGRHTKSPDVPFAEYHLENNTRHFHLAAEHIKHNILKDLTIEAMGYNGSTPGPVIVMRQGECISLTVENRLEDPTALHVHGHDFVIVAADGFPRFECDDTINVASGRRIDIEFLSNNPGIWPINGTKTFHQSNNGETPGGMTTRLVYI